MAASIIGLGSCLSVYWLFYFAGPLLAPLASPWHTPPEWLLLCFLFCMVLASLGLGQWRSFSRSRDKKPLLSFSAGILSLTPILTAFLPGLLPTPAPTVIVFLLFGSAGFAQAVFFSAWLETVSYYQLRQSGILVGLAFALAGIITTIGQTAGYIALLIAVALLPLLSLLTLLRPIPSTLLFPQPNCRTENVRIFPKKLILTFILIYINGGIFFHLLSFEASYLTLFRWSYLAYVCLCPLVAFILHQNESLDLRLIYRVQLPIMLAGFLIFLFRQSWVLTAFALLQAASALFNMYFWLLIPYFSRFTQRPAAACAWSCGIIHIFVSMSGLLAALLSPYLFGSSNGQSLTFVACLISSLLISLFPGEKETFAGWQALFTLPSPAAETDSTSANEMAGCELPTSWDSFGLSIREQEVLSLLAKGRSGPYISEALNISTNTVKTHIRNIYGKLAVRNRQELLSLLQSDIGIN
jgi:DNA-binding CsgD family transcriptional regulator